MMMRKSPISIQTLTNTVPFKSWWPREKEKQDLFGHSIYQPAIACLPPVANFLIVWVVPTDQIDASSAR